MSNDESVPALRFSRGGTRGFISGGKEHGVEVVSGGGSSPVTRPMCLNLEHFYASGVAPGTFVPRYKATRSSRLLDDGIEVVIHPFEDWHVTSTVTLRLCDSAPSSLVFEATYRFEFEAAYSGFEAFISCYFPEPTPPHLRLGGRWVQPVLTQKEHRTWARSGADADALRARLAEPDYVALAGPDFHLPVDAAHYDEPIMTSPVGAAGWAMVHVMDRDSCCSLSANACWHAHDFSLIGRDVRAGEVVTARASMIFTQLAALDDALRFLQAPARTAI